MERKRIVKKIPVAILGATGAVGQRLVSLLFSHPWFEPVALCASGRSEGRPYAEAARWLLPSPMPAAAAALTVRGCAPLPGIALAFSALDSSVAGGVEEAWAGDGALVVSNARNHRMRDDVPLVVPEINPSHLALARLQAWPRGGAIVTNPNCSTIGLALALKPLHDRFGVSSAQVVTLQAASGAGYPGVPSLDLLDNAVPFIEGEEEKLETEPLKLLGTLRDEGRPRVDFAGIRLGAACHRVAVSDGHLAAVSIKLARPAGHGEILSAWSGFSGESAGLGLPSAVESPVRYRDEEDRPQPRLDRDAGGGMAVSAGRLRPCPIMDWKFELLSHNTVRGAAGGTVLLAELCIASGMVPGRPAG